MSNSDFAARVALAAVEAMLRPNPLNLNYLSSEIQRELGDKPDNAAIGAALKRLREKMPEHFLNSAGRPETEAPRAPESATARLERANAEIAERGQENAPKRTVVLSDKEIRLANTMTPQQRAAYCHGLANARAVTP
jgi:selenocysteine lyase/cysteine desulfurase